MKKLLFLLPLLVLGAACGSKQPDPTPTPTPTQEKTVVLNAKNVLGYDATADITYGDSSEAKVVDGLSVTWVGVGCYGQDRDTQVFDADGFFQMRKKSASTINFSLAEGTIKSISLKVATRKSDYDATKPVKVGVGVAAATDEVVTVDFVKGTADYVAPITKTDAKFGSVAYDVDDGYTYTVYLDSITVVYVK